MKIVLEFEVMSAIEQAELKGGTNYQQTDLGHSDLEKSDKNYFQCGYNNYKCYSDPPQPIK